MNHTTLTSFTKKPYGRARPRDFESEARRLRAEHAHDPLARFIILLDLQIRRLAHGVAGLLAR